MWCGKIEVGYMLWGEWVGQFHTFHIFVTLTFIHPSTHSSFRDYLVWHLKQIKQSSSGVPLPSNVFQLLPGRCSQARWDVSSLQRVLLLLRSLLPIGRSQKTSNARLPRGIPSWCLNCSFFLRAHYIDQRSSTLTIERATKMSSSLPEGQIFTVHFHQ